MKRIITLVALSFAMVSHGQYTNYPTWNGSMNNVVVPADLFTGTQHQNKKVYLSEFARYQDSLYFTTYFAHRKSIDSLAAVFVANYYNKTQSDARYLQSSTAASSYQPILVSGTSIKTINGNSLLGSGNLVISGGGSGLTYPNAIKNYLNGYGNWQGLNSDSLTEGNTNKLLTTTERTNIANSVTHAARTDNPHGVTKSQVGLPNVPNVDATNRANHTGTQPISSVIGLQTALDSKQDTSKIYFDANYFGHTGTSGDAFIVKKSNTSDSIPISGGSYAPIVFNLVDSSLVITIAGSTYKFKPYQSSGSSGALISETFNRSNSADLVGSTTSDGTKTWQANDGGVGGASIGISSNQAYQSSGGASTYKSVFISLPTRNTDARVTLGTGVPTGLSGVYLILAHTDGGNSVYVDLLTCGISQNVSNAQTLSVTGSGTSSPGDVIRAVLNGSNLTVYRNGTQITTTSAINTATLTAATAGFQFYQDTTTRIDKLEIF